MIEQKHALPTDNIPLHIQFNINLQTYAQIYIFFCQRAQVVNGLYEPNDEECLNPWRDENEDEELARAVQGAAITEGVKKEEEETKAIE